MRQAHLPQNAEAPQQAYYGMQVSHWPVSLHVGKSQRRTASGYDHNPTPGGADALAAAESSLKSDQEPPPGDADALAVAENSLKNDQNPSPGGADALAAAAGAGSCSCCMSHTRTSPFAHPVAMRGHCMSMQKMLFFAATTLRHHRGRMSIYDHGVEQYLHHTDLQRRPGNRRVCTSGSVTLAGSPTSWNRRF